MSRPPVSRHPDPLAAGAALSHSTASRPLAGAKARAPAIVIFVLFAIVRSLPPGSEVGRVGSAALKHRAVRRGKSWSCPGFWRFADAWAYCDSLRPAARFPHTRRICDALSAGAGDPSDRRVFPFVTTTSSTAVYRSLPFLPMNSGHAQDTACHVPRLSPTPRPPASATVAHGVPAPPRHPPAAMSRPPSRRPRSISRALSSAKSHESSHRFSLKVATDSHESSHPILS